MPMDEKTNDFYVLETMRAEIQAEHTLISHRMGWYVTAQSFLMGAYAIAGSKVPGVAVGLIGTSAAAWRWLKDIERTSRHFRPRTRGG